MAPNTWRQFSVLKKIKSTVLSISKSVHAATVINALASTISQLSGKVNLKVLCDCFYKLIDLYFSQTLLLKNIYTNPKLDLRQADAGTRQGIYDPDEQAHLDEVGSVVELSDQKPGFSYCVYCFLEL